MLKIELAPDLSHCIHTVAKREYEDTLSRLLSTKYGNKKLGEKLEMLTILLKELDCKLLRRESERYLMEGKKVKFIFHLENGVLKYDMLI